MAQADHISVTACSTKKEFRLFERIPEMLHGHDKNFVPPFPGSVSGFFDSRHPFQSLGRIRPFVAWRNGKAVGRIAAIENRAHNEHYSDRTGFFGFFDFVDDDEVASELLRAAEEEVRAFGLESIRGPYNPSSNDECGLLVEGFDSPPFVLMTYNPPRYVDTYEKLGLRKARDLFSFYISQADQGLARTERIVERLNRRANITVRSPNLKRLDKEIGILHHLYNATLGKQWGFVPISKAELDHVVGDLKQVLDPEMVLIAEKDGEPIGISVTIPNVNEFMLRAKSSKGVWRVLRFVWYLKTRRPKECRLAILGVLPEHRSKGVAPAFYFESLRRGREKYEGGELGWILDVNDEVNKAADLMGAKKYKTYRIYEKAV